MSDVKLAGIGPAARGARAGQVGDDDVYRAGILHGYSEGQSENFTLPGWPSLPGSATACHVRILDGGTM